MRKERMETEWGRFRRFNCAFRDPRSAPQSSSAGQVSPFDWRYQIQANEQGESERECNGIMVE
jgi:hypothetical protein